MLTPAIAFYDIVVFIHITAVVLAFGGVMLAPALVAVAARQGPAGRAAAHRILSELDSRVVGIGGIVVLLAGIYLTFVGDRFDASAPFIGIGFVILIVVMGLAGGYLAPRDRQLAELAESGDQAGYDQLAGSVRVVSGLVSLLVIVAIFLMTTKPG